MTRDEAIKILKPILFLDKDKDEALHMTIEALERQQGEWLERNVIQDRRDAMIPEWQSAKCSVCGKYHTTPYMYYFTNYDYCPNCGAKMQERREDDKGRNTTSV